MKPSAVHPVSAPPREEEPVRWLELDLADDELVRRCVEGERWARAALYHRYAEGIANLALRLLRDRDDANDVLQDAFVTAFETIHHLREPDKVGAWLRTVTVRHVQRRFRRRRLRRLLGFRHTAISLDELAARDADQEAVAQVRRVDAVLRALPDRAALVWTLRIVEGESLPAIAELCDVSLATVKRDLASAQDEVRAALEEEDRPC